MPESRIKVESAFGAAIGVSAFTLFLIEPLMGKRLLPVLGGAASVWLVSLVFFQVSLLLGYLGAFFLGRLPLRVQLVAHPIAILILGAATYPFSLGGVSDGLTPEVATLAYLARAVGAPFVILAANASLLSSWAFIVRSVPATTQKKRGDVYGLYSASNLGSLLSLFVFPFVLEPTLGLRSLMQIWSAAYLTTALLVAGAAWITWRSLLHVEPTHTAPKPMRLPALKTWLPWCAYAFLPSALLSAVTNVLVSDVGSIPLLWTVPLGIYLLTYVFAFREQTAGAGLVARYFPFVAVVATVVLVPSVTLFNWTTAAALFLFLFSGGYLAHRRLWDLRPAGEDLSVFYLFVSLGGALGGTFVGLVAPRLFTFTVEFPVLFIVMIFVGARARSLGSARPTRLWLDLAIALVLGALMFVVQKHVAPAVLMLVLGVLALLIYAFRDMPRRFALCLLSLVLMTKIIRADASIVKRARNYYGTIEVTQDETDRRLIHGATQHGLLELARPEEPWTYYSRAGVVGAAFTRAQATHPAPLSYAIVGLGIGTMLTYVRAGEPVTVFEIDRDMVEVASDPALFPFVSAARARTSVDVRVGDARRLLEAVPDRSYDFLALDAFSSDSIPVHLLTREAFLLYRGKLRPDGVLLVHISNRMFDLQGVVQRLAQEIDAPAFMGEQPGVGRQSRAQWIWVGADPPPGYERIPQATELWTDDFSSPIRTLRR
jgi:SAM-dependent methyltransferase